MLTLANALIITIGIDAGVQFAESIDAAKTNWSNMKKHKEKEKHAARSFLRLWGGGGGGANFAPPFGIQVWGGDSDHT